MFLELINDVQIVTCRRR